MSDDRATIAKVQNEIAKINDAYKLDLRRFEDGDFGDLDELDFAGKSLLGKISFWSNGFVFYHLVDKNIDALEIIGETFVDASGMSDEETLNMLSELFAEMKSREV